MISVTQQLGKDSQVVHSQREWVAPGGCEPWSLRLLSTWRVDSSTYYLGVGRGRAGVLPEFLYKRGLEMLVFSQEVTTFSLTHHMQIKP